MESEYVIEPVLEPEGGRLSAPEGAVIIDCRFSLADPEEGRRCYLEGHIPGAAYLDLNQDLSGAVQPHGGRHPLPDAQRFVATLASLGVEADTEVVAYDDSRFAFAARLWWMMNSLDYRSPRLLNGGYQGFLGAGGKPEVGERASVGAAVEQPTTAAFVGQCEREALAPLQCEGAVLIDSREPERFAGVMEPIDPVAGHIPGALNFPWQAVTDEQGCLLSEQALREHFGDVLDAPQLLVYCGSGVTACVNLFGLATVGRRDARLYAGSWSDWCSYL